MTILSESALKERLKQLAKKKGTTFKELSKRLYLERFLVRLEKSDYADRFIFKDGILLGYFMELGRETKDLDFSILASIPMVDVPELKKVFDNICAMDVGDGFQMKFNDIEDRGRKSMNCPVFQVSIEIKYVKGSMRDRLQIDLGVGDWEAPEERELHLMDYGTQPFFEGRFH